MSVFSQFSQFNGSNWEITGRLALLFMGMISGYFLGKYYLHNRVQYRGPNSNDVRKTVYQTENGEYVMFDIDMCLCPPSAKYLFQEK